ncbi:MAG: hypothetical protein ACHQ6V_06230, partial [Myxococcota bacterium]
MVRKLTHLGCAFVAAASLATTAFAQTVNDTALFSAVVPPNVMLLVDNSGSMNEVVWHPSFPPAGPYGCTYFNNADTYYIDTSYDSVLLDLNSGQRRFRPGTYTLPATTGCVTTGREVYQDTALFALNGTDTRWSGEYLNWYFSPAANAAVAAITAANNGTTSACLGGGTYSLYRRSRITAAKMVLREVICQVNQAGAVRFGLGQFRRADTANGTSDPNGGYVAVPINDYLVAGVPNTYTLNSVSRTHGNHLDTIISGLTGESNTPLA